MNPTYIIAEAGVNHNGSLELAKQLIEVAAEAGADAVKFQTYKADNIVSKTAPKANYQLQTTESTESQYEMIKRLELNEEAHHELMTHCRKYQIQFLSTPFDEDSVDLLSEKLNLPLLKIPSGEITNAPLLLKIARTGKPLILSTGMSTMGDIEKALGVLAFGYLETNIEPSIESFESAYCSVNGQALLRDKVTLLHCTTEYPTPYEQVNLRVIDTLSSTFCLPVGYSDHTQGIAVPIAAVACGAVMIEKHFTLDQSLPGPDHCASLEPDELKAMVEGIRQIEPALGSTVKKPVLSEIQNRMIARKSLVASRDILQGEKFNSENMTVKRPNGGKSPFYYWQMLGQVATKDYKKDEFI